MRRNKNFIFNSVLCFRRCQNEMADEFLNFGWWIFDETNRNDLELTTFGSRFSFESRAIRSLVQVQNHSGATLEPFWRHFGATLEPFWSHFGATLESFWRHFGGILEAFRSHSGATLEPLWSQRQKFFKMSIRFWAFLCSIVLTLGKLHKNVELLNIYSNLIYLIYLILLINRLLTFHGHSAGVFKFQSRNFFDWSRPNERKFYRTRTNFSEFNKCFLYDGMDGDFCTKIRIGCAWNFCIGWTTSKIIYSCLLSTVV